MKTLCVGLLAGWLVSAQVPVQQEPRHHFVFENEALRVLEPQIPAGDTTLEHLHAHDDATICIHGSSIRAKPPGGEWSKAGEVCVPGRIGITEYSGNPRSHTVENVGSGVYHLTLVENLRPSGWTNYEPLVVEGLKVAKESRAFRVYEASGVPLHSHQVPTVMIFVNGDHPGQATLIPAGKEHRIAAQADVRVVEIEVR